MCRRKRRLAAQGRPRQPVPQNCISSRREALLGAAGTLPSAPRGACLLLGLHLGAPPARTQRIMPQTGGAGWDSQTGGAGWDSAAGRLPALSVPFKAAGSAELHIGLRGTALWGQPGTGPSAPRGACLPVQMHSCASAEWQQVRWMPGKQGSWDAAGRPHDRSNI